MTKVRGNNHWHLNNKLSRTSDHDCRVRAPATSGHPARGPPGVRGLQRRPACRGPVQAAAGRRAGVETSIFLSRYYDFNELF